MRIFAMICCVLIWMSPPGFSQGRRPAKEATAQGSDWVRVTLERMTVEEKIGQMLVPGLTATFMNQESETFQVIERNITDFHVGGYHAFGGDPAALAILLNRMQPMAKVPLLITADLEGGPGYQFRGATRIPRGMAIGATGSEEMAYLAGSVTALEGRTLGISVNFYPVVDVNNNPRNPIISIRSFGEDTGLVSRMGKAYIRGAQDHGQLATAKHFPGHGDTSQDSHLELAIIDVNRARLDQIELPPFRAAIEAGVGAVMTAHIYLPQVESEKGLPATLSTSVTTGLLRNELGFQGLIFTDAMTMRGVSDHFTPEEATVRAVKAGADIILFPPDVEKSFTAMNRAVMSGEIPLTRIEESVRRILEAKVKLGLNGERMVDVDQLDRVVGSRDNQDVARTIIEQAITLVKDERKVLPLRLNENQRVCLLSVVDMAAGWREGAPGMTFEREFTTRHKNTISVRVDDSTSSDAYDVIKKCAGTCDVVVVNGFIRVAAYKGSVDLNQWQLDLLKHLSKLDKPMVFTLFGSPYLLSFVPELPSYALTYEYYPEAESAAVRAITGEISFRGKLPVSLAGMYPIGHGLTTPVIQQSTPSQ